MIRSAVTAAIVAALAAVTGLTTSAEVAMAGGDGSKVDPVRVMSFNVRYENPHDGENVWTSRREMLVETVRAYDPDLLGMQEVRPTQGEYLKQAFEAGYGYVGTGRDADGGGEASPILFRTARFELLDSGQFWLSETPGQPGSKGWDANIPRIATWARLRDRQADEQLLLINTHFDHRGEVARLESARQIRAWIETEHADLPVILTGDFNTDEDAEPYRVLTADQGPLMDAYRTVHPTRAREEATFNGFEGRKEGGRIDWILHSRHWTARGAAIDRTSRDGRYPSDHYPVTAELVWSQ